MPTKVILQAGNTQYELGYPNQLGRRPDDGPKTGSEPPRFRTSPHSAPRIN